MADGGVLGYGWMLGALPAAALRRAAQQMLTSGTVLPLLSTSYTFVRATASQCWGLQATPLPPLVAALQLLFAAAQKVNCGELSSSSSVVFCRAATAEGKYVWPSMLAHCVQFQSGGKEGGGTQRQQRRWRSNHKQAAHSQPATLTGSAP